MKVCIHRGTKEIGGTCIELEAQGRRIVLDLGLPLDCEFDTTEPPAVSGFITPDDSLLGVVISHPHQDHYGLVAKIRPEIPILIGEAAENILKVAGFFIRSAPCFENTIHLQDRKTIELGPFSITPYLMDHSAYDAYAILVEADGKRLFYSGDFRGHGRKAALFEKFLETPPPHIDAFLMEGTCIGRIDNSRDFPTEDDLVQPMAEAFGNTSGMALLWCSGQNIDRIVTAFKAARQAGRQLILDLYTAEVLRACNNPRLPQADWKSIRVFLPWSQKRRIKEEDAFPVADQYCIHPRKLAGVARKSVMLFRPSMCRDLASAKCLEGATLTYSMWQGYLEHPGNASFLQWLQARNIPIREIHTSGHASVKDLQRMATAVNAKALVPVHSFHTAQYPKLFDNVTMQNDGVWWTV